MFQQTEAYTTKANIGPSNLLEFTTEDGNVTVASTPESKAFSKEADHFIAMYGNIFKAIGDTFTKIAKTSRKVAELHLQASS